MSYNIKTHGRVSMAKNDVRHTSVLLTGTAKSPFSTPHIGIVWKNFTAIALVV